MDAIEVSCEIAAGYYMAAAEAAVKDFDAVAVPLVELVWLQVGMYMYKKNNECNVLVIVSVGRDGLVSLL